jgi:hypothetical protein
MNDFLKTAIDLAKAGLAEEGIICNHLAASPNRISLRSMQCEETFTVGVRNSFSEIYKGWVRGEVRRFAPHPQPLSVVRPRGWLELLIRLFVPAVIAVEVDRVVPGAWHVFRQGKLFHILRD